MEEHAPHTTLGGSMNSDKAPPNEAAALQQVIAELTPLPDDARRRVIDTVCTWFGLATGTASGSGPQDHLGPRASSQRSIPFQFSDAEVPSPKEFMHQKAPVTDVERVACLAFYLARYRSSPHFQTKDITALNTDAAQRRFSNTAAAVDNATKSGYLVPSVKGHKQLSAAGERYVEALPDRQQAREAMERARPKRSSSSSTATKSSSSRS